MRFKPLLCKRLSMHQGNAVLMRILDVALRDACKACRGNKDYADEIPPELEVMDSGTHQPAKEEKEMTKEEKIATYPPTVQKVYRLFAQAYKDRDKLHKQMCKIGEDNDTTSMERSLVSVHGQALHHERGFPCVECHTHRSGDREFRQADSSTRNPRRGVIIFAK